MILIIGGAHQGKGAFARELSGLGQEEFERLAWDGKKDITEDITGKRYLLNFHHRIRRLQERGADTDAYVEEILEELPEIITMDEVGCGIVPLERGDRDYREAVGRAGQRMAARAKQVFRVMCGIPVQIK